MTLGDDGAMLNLAGGHFDGVVIAAFGAGHVPERMVAVLEEMAASVPVILASRIGNGPVLRSTYSFPGSETDLLSRGLISAETLDPYKARLLLYLLLRHGHGRDTIVRAFADAGS